MRVYYTSIKFSERAELYPRALCSRRRHGNTLPARISRASWSRESQSFREWGWKCRRHQPPLPPDSLTSGESLSLRYMVPDLSPASPDVFTLGPPAVLLLGNILSVGVTAGLPTPEELELLDRCWPDGGRTGLMGGGRSWEPATRAERAGLKVVIISEVELLLRRMAASGSRIMMVWSGLPGSELTGFFMGSRVSKTTSGACLTVFCRSSSRSSWRAVDIVFSMSWQKSDKTDKARSFSSRLMFGFWCWGQQTTAQTWEFSRIPRREPRPPGICGLPGCCGEWPLSPAWEDVPRDRPSCLGRCFLRCRRYPGASFLGFPSGSCWGTSCGGCWDKLRPAGACQSPWWGCGFPCRSVVEGRRLRRTVTSPWGWD